MKNKQEHSCFAVSMGVEGPLLRAVWLLLYNRSRNLVSLMALSWQFRNYKTSFLLSAGDVSLVSSNQDLQII